ncbi:cyclic nucleotide-binding domain-containing protein [Thalassomonas sp. M1454]|uniref:cyclic nucleotide-binding domain-containing protein n=1 Tax=Thalassomonas sp. M1454 TaxID=2594477 RepID=UPI00117CA92F|nr:cyclic nucleotide-binding domain-containing protein [Thalassomonas sp. M1454]TRX54951.1 mechanosensitive ion channel [Thalassomonas sp. M1454]
MEFTEQLSQIFGFFILLSASTVLLVRLASVIIQRRKLRFRYGVEAGVILWFLYHALEPGLQWIDYGHYALDIKNAVAFLWWINLAFVIDTLTSLYLWDGLLSEKGKRRTPKLITGGVTFILYTLAIIIVLHFYYDKPIGALLTASGAVALIVGFSAQSTLKEVFSGVSLNATRAIRMGDFIEVNGTYGEVYDINWRSISIKNPHTDSLYIFPNSTVSSQVILNFSEPTPRFKYYINFTVEPSAPPEKVIRAIESELKYSRYVFRTPKPDFNILGFTEYGLEIRLRFFFDGDDPWWDAQNEVCMAVWGAMKKHGFRLSLKRGQMHSPFEWDELQEKLVQRLSPQYVLNFVKETNLLKDENDSQLALTVDDIMIEDLNPPSCFHHINDNSDFLYIVLEGKVEIYSNEDDVEICVQTCLPGDYFGLREVVENKSHQYYAQAKEYSVVAKVSKDKVNQLIDNNNLNERFKSNIASVDKLRSENKVKELERLIVEQQSHAKYQLSVELRKSIDHLLKKSLLTSIKEHLGFLPSHRRILHAVMAGCALLCKAAAEKESSERNFIISSLNKFDFFKHSDERHGAQILDDYLERLNKDPEIARKHLIDLISKQAKNSKNAHLIAAICWGMVDPKQFDDEAVKLVMKDICDALQIPLDVHSIREKLKSIRLA